MQPNKDFIAELAWRGLIHDIMPETADYLRKNVAVGYVGFDPTATSLTIGNFVTVMLLVHFQHAGHIPVALVGGATGMVGDPSGKSAERNLMDEKQLQANVQAIRQQLEKYLDFSDSPTQARLVNNYDWMKEFSFLGFLRDVGKHLTVGYMLTKDSVKRRLEGGLSFTEFAYQLLQGYDFYYLYTHMNCKLQMGGSDQWGNITAGTELVRRMGQGEAFAVTAPLLTRADGTKFGKSEGQNIWLDPALTSPYKFYQFFLNVTDEEASKYIRIFTLLSKEEIETLEQQHALAPHERLLQKELARLVTCFVHSEADFESAVSASEMLFGKGGAHELFKLPEAMLLSVLEGVPTFQVAASLLDSDLQVVPLLGEHAEVFPSKGEARKNLQAGGVSINKVKVTDPQMVITSELLLHGKYLMVQRGKKNYYLIKFE